MKKALIMITMGVLLPLSAQSNEGLRFGVTAGVISGYIFRTASLQIRGFAKYDLGSGHAVTASFNVNNYKSPRLKLVVITVEKKTFKHRTIGVDYGYHFSKQQFGTYCLAGVNITERSDSKDSNKALGQRIGIGYDFNKNLGVQACYNRCVKHDDGSSQSNAGFAMTYTF